MLPFKVRAIIQGGVAVGAIPEFLRVLFWDTDPASMDLWNHKKFIIERILEFGDEDAYRWMFRA